jgi:hypothetical protein
MRISIQNKSGPAGEQALMEFDCEDTITQEENSNEFLYADIDNIRKMLPILYPGQHDNILFAEQRFLEGKGVMFTDGTGTGKTFTGCGIIYRFFYQDKRNILIIVPTDQKCIDWIEEAQKLDLSMYQLIGIQDAGHDITVTTYANFYQNNALNKRAWDLVIYDESHYLCQNQQGIQTSYFEQHKSIVNLPSSARDKAKELNKFLKPEWDGSREYYQKLEHYEDAIHRAVEKLVLRTKVVFLSATPFAYHKSIKYADGTLIDIEEQIVVRNKATGAYNEAPPFGDFLIENFGYQMKYNKVTIPESGVDVNLMEREFFEKMKKNGIISTRMLELKHDYSRDFVTIDSEIGDRINEGMELFYEESFKKTFPTLAEKFSKKYNYMYVNQLLECIKAKEIHTRIQQHLDLGRKVVIFHSYNHAAVEHPFHFDPYKLIEAKQEYILPRLEREIKLFEKLYPEYYNLDLSHLENTRDAILRHFPETKQFNGTISKKLRSQYLKDFNSDHGNTNILLVQQKAGKEGISLHDRTGNFQRVLMQLGLPTEPTSCIQIEGRTYRDGVKSNAPYEYMTLQTTFERIAFGTKIAERSRTAENLAMGNLARDLETSFKEGYLNSSYKPPSIEQGIGGKQMDKFNNNTTKFDKAISYYFSRAKRNSKNKAKEGGDYYATPEPLGLKMVEWLNPQPDENGLEPSAGHGAIARWFPGFTNNHFVEENINLTGELCINSIGQVRIGKFEDHSSINKYNFIAMNPPFGTSGKTAMEHLQKALVRHSDRYDTRLIAIIPAGPSMDKRLEMFLNSEKGKDFYVRTQIRLPSCTFERAGTSVSTKILEIRKMSYINNRPQTNYIDLSYIQTIKDFFEEIRDLKI